MKKIFLGGTCNGSTWRDRLILLLNFDFYNPIVDDWTVECMEQEVKERSVCDFCLYTVTPKMEGVYTIAEVVDDSNKRPDKTILCLLKEDEGFKFSNSQWKSLYAVSMMVDRNGGKVFFNLQDVADYVNNF